MKKIKVLHIVKSLGRGGAETLLLETLKQHNREHFQFYYIYFLPWKNQLVNELEMQDGIVVNINASNNFQILLSCIKLNKFIKKHRIEIVHSHLPWAGIVSRIACKFSKVKLIYSEHNIQERYHLFTKWMNKITYKWQHTVIAVSKSVEDSIHKNIAKDINTIVILNGVDTSKFEKSNEQKTNLKKELGINPDEIVIGNVCVFRSQKRLKIWVDIFEKINIEYPNTKGVLVGAGILFEEIKNYIYEKKLQDKIILTGLKTNSSFYFNVIDIFLLTSEFEGLPIALLEAMSTSCVPIVTNAGGVKEVIQNHKNGLIVDVDKPYEMIDKLRLVINDKSLRDKYSNNARQTVINNFSIKNTTEQLEDLYFNILEN